MTVGGGWYVGLPAHPTGHGNCLQIPFSQAFSGGMCRFELRIEEADFETFGGGGGYMVVGGGNQL